MKENRCHDVLLGKGVLNWRAFERRTDRYGAVCLYKDHSGSDVTVPFVKIEGFGKLVAIIKENRTSTHIGDLFHGFFPEKPKVGEVIELGEGNIFYEVDEYGETVGLQPKNGRVIFWLNPQLMYRCHGQTVELYFRQ
jgi:hypothetical protein